MNQKNTLLQGCYFNHNGIINTSDAYIVVKKTVPDLGVFKENPNIATLRNLFNIPEDVYIISLRTFFETLSHRFTNLVNLESYMVDDLSKLDNEVSIFEVDLCEIFKVHGVDYNLVNFFVVKAGIITYKNNIWECMEDSVVRSTYCFTTQDSAFIYGNVYNYLMYTGNHAIAYRISFTSSLFNDGQNNTFYYNSLLSLLTFCKKKDIDLERFFDDYELSRVKMTLSDEHLLKFSNRKLSISYVPDDFREIIYNNIVTNMDKYAAYGTFHSGYLVLLVFMKANGFDVVKGLEDFISNAKSTRHIKDLMKNILLHADNLFKEEKEVLDEIIIDYLNNNLSLYSRTKLMEINMYKMKDNEEYSNRMSYLLNELGITKFDLMLSFSDPNSIKLLQNILYSKDGNERVNMIYTIINYMDKEDFDNTINVITHLFAETVPCITRTNACVGNLLFIYNNERREQFNAHLLATYYVTGTTHIKKKIEEYVKNNDFKFNSYVSFDETSLRHTRKLARMYMEDYL